MICSRYIHVRFFNYLKCSSETNQEDTRDNPPTETVGEGGDLGGIIGVFSRMQSYHIKKSDTPPPPYEEPPPYHIAVIMEQCQAYTVSYPVLV